MAELHPTQWNDIKERGGMFSLTLVLAFYRLGGRWLCRVLMYFIILWFWIFSVTARQASLQYLTRLHHFAGPDSPFKNAPGLSHSYLHLMQFGECILDKIEGWLGKISEQQLVLQGNEHLRAHYQKGAVIVVSHFNLWRDNMGMSQAHVRLFGGMLIRLPHLLSQKVKG